MPISQQTPAPGQGPMPLPVLLSASVPDEVTGTPEAQQLLWLRFDNRRCPVRCRFASRLRRSSHHYAACAPGCRLPHEPAADRQPVSIGSVPCSGTAGDIRYRCLQSRSLGRRTRLVGGAGGETARLIDAATGAD